MKGRLQSFGNWVRSPLLVIAIVVVGNPCNAVPLADRFHESTAVAGNPAQPVDRTTARDEDALGTQASVGSQANVIPKTTPEPVDEIGAEIRFFSSCVTVGVVVFTLGVLGFVTLGPVPPRTNPSRRT